MKDYAKAHGLESEKTIDKGLRAYLLGIYYYLTASLLVTGVAAFATLSFSPLTQLIFSVTPHGQIYGVTGIGQLLMFSPIGIAFYFFFGFSSMTLEKAKVLLWVYAALTGISLSTLGLMYTGASLAKTFFVCSAAFLSMSIYGYSTKRNLTSFGSFFYMGLIGLLVASVINIFIGSSAIYFATSVLGIVIFMGLIAWNTQKLKNMYYSVGGGELGQKFAVMGAFQLYLDFINLFLYLVRFIGDRRN